MRPTFITLAAAGILAIGLPASAQSLLDRVTDGVSNAATAVGDAAESAGEAVAKAVTPPTGAELDAGADAALKRLFAETPETKELNNKAVAVLVFPKITKAGFMVGGQYGEGAMREGGKTSGYYSIASGSYGLQVGGQQYSYVMFFMNKDALQYFKDNRGWEAGSGPTLVGGREGWSSSMGTNDLQGDIVPVFFGQAGLMAGAGLQGSKITRVDR